MKKLITFLAAVFFFLSVSFAKNFISKRFFEIQLGVPVDFANNTMNFDEIFVKDLCIDLKKIADDVPDEGFNLIAITNPYFGINFNFGPVHVGTNLELDVYENLSVSKALFDFLGKGNEIGKEDKVDVKNYTDIFVALNLDVGIEFKKFSLFLNPSVFVPVMSSSKTNIQLAFVNDENGNVNFSADTNLNMFSNLMLNSSNQDDMINDLIKGIGFDLGGSLTFPVNKFLVTATARIPVIPGSYKYNMNMTTNTGYQVSLSDFSTKDNSNGNSATVSELSEKQYINRPLKVNAYVDYKMLAGLLEFRGGVGLGVYHPFLEDAFPYPEYYLSAGLNFLDFLKAKVSTEYTNQLFKHQFAADLNIRIIEIECGVSLQSTNLAKSFSKTGFGGYAVVSFGF